MTVACQYGNACSSPAKISCPSIKIEPGYPTVRQDISTNREVYNKVFQSYLSSCMKDYVAFFNVAKLLATKMVILDHLANQIVSNSISFSFIYLF